MTTPYVDPQSVHNPTAGAAIPATWGDAVRDDCTFFATPPSCRATRTTTQSISNATATAVSLTAEDWDSDAFHSTSSNQSRVTVPTGLSGRYSFHGSATFASNVTGNRIAYLYKNGAGVWTGPVVTGVVTSQVDVYYDIELTAGDYVELFVYQNSGGALNVNTAVLTATWVSLRLT